MILFLLICSLIVIAVLERLSRRQSGRRLYVSFSADGLSPVFVSSTSVLPRT